MKNNPNHHTVGLDMCSSLAIFISSILRFPFTFSVKNSHKNTKSVKKKDNIDNVNDNSRKLTY